MDTRWKSNAKFVLWLFLFTFGLSGVTPLLVSSYYARPAWAYADIICGAGALAACGYALKVVPVANIVRSGPWRAGYNRIPLDVRLLATFICLVISFIRIPEVRLDVSPYNPFDVISFARFLVSTTIVVTLTLFQVMLLFDVLRDASTRSVMCKQSLVYRFASAVRGSFIYRSTGFQLSWVLLVFFASGFGLMVVFLHPAAVVLYVPLLLIVTAPTLFAACRRTAYVNRITATAFAVAEGGTMPDLPVRGDTRNARLAESINRMKHGVERSQAAEEKSERLKTDLITNVSHDLRTPLTSIITYTELLKQQDLTESDMALYIDIIDQKSQRLKILIDDLFEASKMASGSVELATERVDVTQLLQQALAERDESIAASSLDFRVAKPGEPVYFIADGQKMWRVFDNLIGNILKYSLEHTRVYVSVEQSQTSTTLIFKNVSKYELNTDIDELFERFKRGDESRHTEGSGLGLAIAKSIVALHGGTLDIDIDGDLFKAIITMPNGE